MKYFTYAIAVLTVLLFSSTGFSLEESGINIEVLTATNVMWDGTVLPNYPTEKPEITILKITVAPKAALPMHKHPVINAGYMVKGNLTVNTMDGETLNLKTGDTIIELVNKWHYGKNEGDVPAEIIVFYAGNKDQPYTVLKK